MNMRHVAHLHARNECIALALSQVGQESDGKGGDGLWADEWEHIEWPAAVRRHEAGPVHVGVADAYQYDCEAEVLLQRVTAAASECMALAAHAQSESGEGDEGVPHRILIEHALSRLSVTGGGGQGALQIFVGHVLMSVWHHRCQDARVPQPPPYDTLPSLASAAQKCGGAGGGGGGVLRDMCKESSWVTAAMTRFFAFVLIMYLGVLVAEMPLF